MAAKFRVNIFELFLNYRVSFIIAYETELLDGAVEDGVFLNLMQGVCS
jgi:hypothetical protein